MPSLIHLSHRGLLSLKGRDTFKYLQALTTNSLANPTSQFTCFLNAQGRVLYEAFIYKTGESECLIETDKRHVASLLDHLKRYKLRSKVEMRAIDAQESAVYQYMSEQAPALASSSPLDELLSKNSLSNIFRDPRGPGLGWRITSSKCPAESLETTLGELGDYTTLRYTLGVPEGIEELVPGKALPMESNIDYMSGLDFHKGCYLGQELTIRTHHTGIIRKRIVPILINKTADKEGADAEHRDAEHEAGKKGIEAKQQWYPNEGETCEVSKPLGGTGRSGGRVLGTYGSLGLGLMRLQQVNQTYTANVNGQTVSVSPMLPKHWPQQPESV